MKDLLKYYWIQSYDIYTLTLVFLFQQLAETLRKSSPSHLHGQHWSLARL